MNAEVAANSPMLVPDGTCKLGRALVVFRMLVLHLEDALISFQCSGKHIDQQSV